ncbi:hypothetical protein FEK35_16805 [Nocardia cyriacigeorgica]|uniref:Uncharacterized protein n=1 Tax=Nocardia cyriacigeorgica TaxID=135487 RepID=A0A5R8PC48_9NOCA|nr:hypothetical protein [Nocardia cyriacigeorgica]TLG08836.1 hypothetical protein FEK35_16805 [Nocardia cyriacigeorgica]
MDAAAALGASFLLQFVLVVIAALPAARRAGIARLLVVLALVAGIVAIQNAHCAAGSAMTMKPAMTTAAALGSDGGGEMTHRAIDPATHSGPRYAVTAAVLMPSTNAEHGAPTPACDTAMACLAVSVALLVTLAIVHPALIRSRHRLPLPLRARYPVSALPRPPSLAALCVLRT